MSKEKLCIYKPWNEKTTKEKNELTETLQKNILEDIIKKLGFEQKETTNFEKVTEQWKSNYTLYIVEKWSKLKLIKDGKESIIDLPVDSIIWESTFLQYLKWEKITNANASVEIQWKYLQISFEKIKFKLKTGSEKKEKTVISYFKEIENQRRWKTKQVHNKN